MVRTSNPDHFCIVLPFFRPLGVPLYAFGAKKKASCTFLNSPSACFCVDELFHIIFYSEAP